jgi:ADP-heptose:LPS heptosyltransferase
MVHDLAARLPACAVVEDRTAWPFAHRLEQLWRRARGTTVVVLRAGVLPVHDALSQLVAAVATGTPATWPRVVDVEGEPLGDGSDASSCLVFARSHWREGTAAATPYRTPALLTALAQQIGGVAVAAATVVAAGHAGLPPAARGAAAHEFDHGLSAAGVPVLPAASQRVLVVILRTLGDCVLATPILTALHERWPQAHLSVLTETRYAWVFAHHRHVREVLTTDLADDELFWREDQAIVSALHGDRFDHLIVLSDRLDHVSYHHSGRSLQATYFAQAGLPRDVDVPGEVVLPAPVLAERDAALTALGLEPGGYAALHLRAGWPEKSLPTQLASAVAVHLHAHHGMPVVVVGAEPEPTLPPSVIDTGGKLSLVESAAFIAGARVFIGPDSGPLHLANAFGVPSLALYAGSAMAVAPPTAAGSRAVQSPTSCALACGVSPCQEACSFAGLDITVVRNHLDAIVRGDVGGAFAGAEPACHARARDGLHRVTPHVRAEPTWQVATLPAPEAGAGTPTSAQHSGPPAARRHVATPTDLATLRAHARAALAQGVSAVRHEIPATAPVCLAQFTPHALALPARVAVAFTLIDLARARGLPLALLRTAGDALHDMHALQHGVGQAPRPAAQEFVARALHCFLHAAAEIDPAGAALACAIHRAQELIAGSVPDLVLLRALCATSDPVQRAPGIRRELCAMAERAQKDALEHSAVLALVRLLPAIDAAPQAETILTRHLAGPALGCHDRARGEFHLARALLLARDPRRLRHARNDAAQAARLLSGPDQRAAHALVAALGHHERACAHSSEPPPRRPEYINQRISSTTESRAPAR